MGGDVHRNLEDVDREERRNAWIPPPERLKMGRSWVMGEACMRFGGLRRYSLKWWLALPFSLGHIYRRLSPKDPTIQGMTFWWHGDLPRRPAVEVFEAAAGSDLRLVNPGRRDPSTSTTLFEVSCILLGLRQVQAGKVLEIGTFDGNTTLNLAANVPDDGGVVTVDLPLEGDSELALRAEGRERNVTDRTVVGEQFQGRPESSRIRQIFGDSARLDWGKFGGPFDVVFIDGCHSYDYVVSDTEHALDVLRPGGLLLWHDYAEMESVSRAVDSFRGRLDGLCALEGTRLAAGFKKAD